MTEGETVTVPVRTLKDIRMYVDDAKYLMNIRCYTFASQRQKDAIRMLDEILEKAGE